MARGSLEPWPERRRLTASTAHASTASTTTSLMVPGTRCDSSADRVSAVKAAMSPNGTNTTRVTVKISTMPMASRT